MCRGDRERLSKPLLDLHPRLDIGYAIFDAVNDHFRSDSDRRAVETLGGQAYRFPPTM